jgi:hypothetical protein
MQENPYAAPTVEAVEVPATAAEAMRRQYLSHEASVKSIGSLYFLGAIFLIPIGLFLVGGTIFGAFAGEPDFPATVMIVVGFMYFAIGSLQAVTAIGLRRLQPWARIVAAILSAFGLLAIPIGTLIAAYFLYLLLSEKGSVVFSEEYKQVIAETPHIKYRTSIIVVVLLGLLLFLLFMGIMAAIFSV